MTSNLLIDGYLATTISVNFVRNRVATDSQEAGLGIPRGSACSDANHAICSQWLHYRLCMF